MDRDGSGDIDVDEFTEALRWFGLTYTDEQLLALFGVYDVDRSGAVEFDEFVGSVLGEEFRGFNLKKPVTQDTFRHTTVTTTQDMPHARRATSSFQSNIGAERSADHEETQLTHLQRDLDRYKMQLDSETAQELLHQHGFNNATLDTADSLVMFCQTEDTITLEKLRAWWYRWQQHKPQTLGSRIRNRTPHMPVEPSQRPSRGKRPVSALTLQAASDAARCYSFSIQRPLSERIRRPQ